MLIFCTFAPQNYVKYSFSTYQPQTKNIGNYD
jgi:hypothetical protein